MQRASTALLLAAALIPLGCAAAPMYKLGYAADSDAMIAEHHDEMSKADKKTAEPLAPRGPDGPTRDAVTPRKVVYTARLQIIVADVASALARGEVIAKQHGGYVQHLTGSRITLRVPAEKFQPAVDDLAKLGPLADRDITAQDVTEQYTDLEIRLTNARATLKRLQAILEKASNVKDVLAIEQELARVRTEIERMQGRMNLLASRIAYATITVTFRRSSDVPQHIRMRLPFWWLGQLGLETLMDF